MASIETVVKVNITKGTRQVPVAGFGIGMILATFNNWSDRFRVYGSFDDLAIDFQSSDDVYKAGLAYFGQSVQPTSLVVGRRLAPVAQIVTVTPNVSSQQVQHFIQTINGIIFDFTSDSSPTAAEVVTGLTALINANLTLGVTATGSTTLILTSNLAGQGFTHAESANLAAVTTMPNHGVAEDINDIQQLNDNWYALILLDHTAADVLEAAAYIETQKKIFGTSSQDSNVIGVSTTDIASKLHALSYARTWVMYSGVADTVWPEAAWMGRVLPDGVGSSTWKFKALAGVVSDQLSGTAISNAQGKSCNIYTPVGGLDITEEGVMASGEYIDVTRFIDWLVSTMETNVYSLLVNNEKIPFTNKGIATVENAVLQTLQEGLDNGGVSPDPAPTVTVPDILAVPTQDKAARTLNGVVFTCTLAGAIHKVNIQGFVSV
jgi:hypothetical protein